MNAWDIALALMLAPVLTYGLVAWRLRREARRRRRGMH